MLAWASAFYMPAILAAPMAESFGLAATTVFAMFSVSLFVSGLAGPLAGRAIDRFGGRPVLMFSNALFAAGLLLLAAAVAPWMLALGWLLLGLAMGCGLYEAAFATVVRLQGSSARRAITGIALLGGFASTLGWTLSALMLAHGGWRFACLGWAVLHLVVGLPLHARLQRVAPGIAVEPGPATQPAVGVAEAAPPAEPPIEAGAILLVPRYTLPLLALSFSLHWFVTTAYAAHLPGLLAAAGATAAATVLAASLVGPSQVAGRLLDFGFLQRLSALRVARLSMLSHPLGAVLLLAFGAAAAIPFAVLHGMGNGILTIAKGSLPLQLFGPVGYGARQGWLVLPGRLLQGLAPWLFGLALADYGVGMLWFSGALCVAAFAALLPLRLPPKVASGV
ncbi:MAG: MFS transporter [Pseudomonadota bacterium]|nr:MFS transporter [Pseudomonadota bacterium]